MFQPGQGFFFSPFGKPEISSPVSQTGLAISAQAETVFISVNKGISCV